MHDFVIIDPSSPEFNRGSFLYLPYILFSALRSKGFDVVLLEKFVCENIDAIPKAKKYLVALTSYPQIDACLVLDRFLPEKPHFFGYYPLIDSYRFQKYRIPDQHIKDGIADYVLCFKDFKTILLSDCDMHLTKYSGTVYPLFTSYGCENKCKFCPVSVNCNSNRIVVPIEKVKLILDFCEIQGYKNIHFTDEDFFFDPSRAKQILKHTQGKGFNYIALGSVHTVSKFIAKFGTDIFEETGMRLIEIGLESADSVLNKAMGKGGRDRYSNLAEVAKGKVDIFWLTMTFFPGETISALRSTGLFLEQYGFKLEELYGRIQTNSTPGGLGQFYQSYIGTPENQNIGTKGISLSARPMRLIPSFVPYSFLECVISKCRKVSPEEKKWFRLYKIDMSLVSMIEDLFSSVRIGQKLDRPSIKDMYSLLLNLYPAGDIFTTLAIMARLGVIE
ncbi:radical SAM protein [Patescibacteria group bacterium]|uniref:Putative radical SAM superfamily protein n=1 Tax=viral metagenome TaxID=1070528 RepID=A0A6M3MEY0_9ZZZZ|nr:radical SAM protein [Patescibacteria group bacterium]MBU0847517.1 radical SAM protein [Patescibacteria group bacterium]